MEALAAFGIVVYGLAPAWRPRLGDGILDLHLVDTGSRFAALRLALSLANGRLGRSRLYPEVGSAGLAVSPPDRTTALAWDRQIGPGCSHLRCGIPRWALTVHRPDVRRSP